MQSNRSLSLNAVLVGQVQTFLAAYIRYCSHFRIESEFLETIYVLIIAFWIISLAPMNVRKNYLQIFIMKSYLLFANISALIQCNIILSLL